MPDTLSLSAGVSFGLLAGIVSGVCYLVANGLTWPKDKSQQQGQRYEQKRCLTASEDDCVCGKCGGDTQGGLIPCVCQFHRPVKFESGAWFLRQVQRAVSLMPWSISTDKLEQIDEECEGRESPGPSESREMRNVREFLETLSAQLAGGPLEGTRIAPLYDHPAYLPRPRNESPSSAQHSQSSGASGAHAQLKRLVARVVEEASALPALARYAAEPTNPPSLESSTYEDLLATAILNKVIERYQTENGSGGRSSGIHSASASPTPSERSSPRSINSRHTRDISPPLPEEDVSDWEEGATEDAVELPKRVPFPEFGGDIIHQDNTERDFDEVSGSDIQAVDGTWEENWLFQKKKIKTIQSVPVPMLVPNSNTEYRALIGDRDADDTTDLSDNASDPEEDQDQDYKSDMKKVLDSKHVIGGKPKVEEILDFEPDSLTILDNMREVDNISIDEENVIYAINKEIHGTDETDNVSNLENKNDSILVLGIDSGPMSKTEFSLKEEIHRTLLQNNNEEFLFEESNKEINGELSEDVLDNMSNIKGSTNTLNRHEREGEYEETVTVPVQRYADSLRRKHFEDEPQEIPTRDTDDDIDELIPGSIAYRERKKWLNYVEMPNNPYSPEAIKKRLSTKSTSSLFDMITTKVNEIDDDVKPIEKDDKKNIKQEQVPVKDDVNKSSNLISNSGIFLTDDGRRSLSPAPKILKDVLAEEVPLYKRYGRDYYIKEAKKSSGARKKSSYSDTSSLSSLNKSTSLDNFDTEFAAPGLLIKQFNTIATNQQYTKFAGQDTTMTSITTISNGNNDQIIIDYEDSNENTLFSAKPAFVDADTDKRFDEILQTAYKTKLPLLHIEDKYVSEPERSPTNHSIDNSYVSSSSLEDSIKIYNVQTGEIVKCKPEDNLSSRYHNAVDKNENIEILDKNVLEENVHEFSPHIDLDQETVIIEDSIEDDTLEKNSEIDDILSQLPKVKELAKKFISMENLNEPVKLPQPYTRRRRSKENILNGDTEKTTNKQTYMHSLTARSISKEFREELKMSMSTPLKVPGGSKEIPEGTEEIVKESSRPGSPLPEPGTIKSKLAFFESLKNKFSTK